MKKAILLFFVSTVAFAAGYEKSILWGGKYAGVAGAGAAGVKGSDSIFYNPAGLVNSSLIGDVTFNLTNTTSQFKGPIVPKAVVVTAGTPPSGAAFTYGGKQESSDLANTTIPGITYSMKINDAWAFGLGYYGIGGARANYQDVDFAPRNFKAKVGSEISIAEFAAGVGYVASESLRFGLALRYTMTNANFSSLGYATSGTSVAAISNIEIKDIKTANLDSVRLGAQYDLSESTKIGLVVRTETKVSTTGKASGFVNTCVPSGAGAAQSCAATPTIAVNEVDAKVETSLPMAVNLGIEHALSPTWTLFGEVVQTQYSVVDKVLVDGTFLVGTTPKQLESITQKWKDQTNVKIAADWHGMSWPVRFGYLWTSEVADADYARAAFTPPGAASTYTLGTGQEFKIGDSTLDFNVALDYTAVSSTVGSASPQPLFTPAGSYEVSATGIHTGFAYKF